MTNLNARELATVLAALRYYQNDMAAEHPLWQHGDISTNCGTLEPLTVDEIDSLCERINTQPDA